MSTQGKRTSMRCRWQGWSWRKRGLVVLVGVVLIVGFITVTLIPAEREWKGSVLTSEEATPEPVPEQVRDWDKPTDPRELEAYNFAHSLELPDSLPKTVPFDFGKYSRSDRSTTAEAYFDHLCATEAGEYIFRTVDKVEGIYQMRAMPKREDKVMTDRYAFEDPADWSLGEEDGSPSLFIGGPGNGFRYFESARQPDDIANQYIVKHWQITSWENQGIAPYWRYHNFDYRNQSGQVIPIKKLESRYAYTWRGIRRDADRKHDIAGGELIVLDHITGEILGVRRSFAIARTLKNGQINWEFAYFCPASLKPVRQQRVVDKIGYPFSFVFQVLKPVDFDRVIAVKQIP